MNPYEDETQMEYEERIAREEYYADMKLDERRMREYEQRGNNKE